MTLVAEWSSLEEIKAVEWQYKDILIDVNDQMWKDISEDWQKVLIRRVPPCENAIVSRKVSYQTQRVSG